MKFTLDNIEFEIIKYEIEDNYSTSSNMYYNNTLYRFPTLPKNRYIKLIAITNSNNYIAVNNFLKKMSSYQQARYYKNDLNFKYLKIYGMYPIEYSFNKYNIEVTFSADYIEGDFYLLQKQKIRKEKIKKIYDKTN